MYEIKDKTFFQKTDEIGQGQVVCVYGYFFHYLLVDFAFMYYNDSHTRRLPYIDSQEVSSIEKKKTRTGQRTDQATKYVEGCRNGASSA